MKAIGVDIFCLDRIDLNKTHVIKRILSEKEYEVFQNISNEQSKKEYLGGRFAAKEAYIKADHPKAVYNKIEILNDENGKPYFSCDTACMVSISHEKEYAVAFVVNMY